MTPQQIGQAAKLLADPDCDVAEICRTFGVHRTTMYRNVKDYEREKLSEQCERGELGAVLGGIACESGAGKEG